VYGKEKEFSCLMLEENELIPEETQVELLVKLNKQSLECDKVWKLYFYGAYSKEGNGEGCC